ncbi:MAG: hypothetical protein IPG24_15985 [Leptospiraceae bacterium]|nr:hypothetical protein [Leptospiraceae bacterium]
MNIDIHTLAIIMSITILMQAIVLSVQMRIDFTTNLPSLQTIYYSDYLLLYYIGILRFFGKRKTALTPYCKFAI